MFIINMLKAISELIFQPCESELLGANLLQQNQWKLPDGMKKLTTTISSQCDNNKIYKLVVIILILSLIHQDDTLCNNTKYDQNYLSIICFFPPLNPV